MLKRVFLFTIIFIQAGVLIAQNEIPPERVLQSPHLSDKKITFYKYKNSHRQVKLKPGKFITVYDFDSTGTYASCVLYAEFDSTLYVYGATVTVELGGKTKAGDWFDSHSSSYPGDSIIAINFKNIDYIYAPRTFLETAGIGLFAVSLSSTLLIAPAVSINFSKRSFNSARYFDVLYPSLGAFAVGLTLPIFHRYDRKLKVNP